MFATTADFGDVYKRQGKKRYVLRVEPARIQEFFTTWGEPTLSEGVDWDEVCLKLRLRKRGPGKKLQGLDPDLHREIISVLRHRHVLLTVPELATELHIDDIPLRPERLPAGQIVAYAPGMRFLQQDSTRYGLREWVEADGHNRGCLLYTSRCV